MLRHPKWGSNTGSEPLEAVAGGLAEGAGDVTLPVELEYGPAVSALVHRPVQLRQPVRFVAGDAVKYRPCLFAGISISTLSRDIF